MSKRGCGFAIKFNEKHANQYPLYAKTYTKNIKSLRKRIAFAPG